MEYWDISKIYFPDITFVGEIKRAYVRKIENLAEVERMLSTANIKRCFFVIIITFNGKVIKLYRLLTKYNCYLIFFARVGLPFVYTNESIFKKFYKHLP